MFECASQESQFRKLLTKRQFQEFAERYKGSDLAERAQKIFDILDAPLEYLSINNCGSGVNSEWDDYYPIISPDGRTLYFCSTRPGGYGGEDIWVSKFKNGRWLRAENIGPPLNTESNEGVMSVSADGLTLFLFGGYAGTKGGGDIFVAHFQEGRWTHPVPLSEEINSTSWDVDATITSDGRALFFTSSRPHTTGKITMDDIRQDSDIYVSVLTDEGWSQPINLGPTINTDFDERSPCLHPDGKTFYFCSKGHVGLGDFDVFKSIKMEESWTEWSEPINLGQELNTPGEDVFYTIPASGKYAYFSSQGHATYGGFDIYTNELPTFAAPEPVTMIAGKITDAEGNPIGAIITWEDLDTGEQMGITRSNPVTGEYSIFLPAGKRYGYTASKDGYFFQSGHIILTNQTEYIEIPVNISLKPLEKDVEVIVHNLFFDYNSANLRSESEWELKRLGEIMIQYVDMQIEIQGHTCSIGSDEYNLDLSERRARAVAGYLVGYGISPSRMFPRGYGEQYPIAPNDSEENREMNRRVVIKILEFHD